MPISVSQLRGVPLLFRFRYAETADLIEMIRNKQASIAADKFPGYGLPTGPAIGKT
jgi:hypothetical protein